MILLTPDITFLHHDPIDLPTTCTTVPFMGPCSCLWGTCTWDSCMSMSQTLHTSSIVPVDTCQTLYHSKCCHLFPSLSCLLWHSFSSLASFFFCAFLFRLLAWMVIANLWTVRVAVAAVRSALEKTVKSLALITSVLVALVRSQETAITSLPVRRRTATSVWLPLAFAAPVTLKAASSVSRSLYVLVRSYLNAQHHLPQHQFLLLLLLLLLLLQLNVRVCKDV